jgi:6-phosphogluconolactonase
MKFSKLSQLFLVSSIGLLVAILLTACQIVTVDYVYVASSAGSGTSSNGQIETFAADSESGALRTVYSPVSTGGVDPTSMAVTSDYANLYVANEGSNTIVHFSIALNGVLTAEDTATLSTTPVSLAVNSAGTYLYVTSCASSAISPKLVCTGSTTLTEYALSSLGAIGSATSQQPLQLYGTYAPYNADVLVPTGIAVLANNSQVSGNAVYVTAYDQSAYNPGCDSCTLSAANPGWVFGFTIGTGGVLVPATNPYTAGVMPSAIASDPTDRFIYVTDYANNQLIGYTIVDGSVLNYMPDGPFVTGNEPNAVAVDPRGKFVYVTNALSSTVSAYAILIASGNPTLAIGTSTNSTATDAEPVAVAVDPALGRFVYTANYLGNSVSGLRLNPTTGALTPNEATPYPTGSRPTALVVVPHGNHAVQSVTP